MHIAYVCADQGISVFGRNGAATHVRELVGGLVAAGADIKLLVPQVTGDAGFVCDLIPFESDPIPSKLRRLTATIEGSDEPRSEASQLHGLALNQGLLEHLEQLHARWPVDLVYERQSLWSYTALQFARRHRRPFFLEVNAPLVIQQEQYRTLHGTAAARAIERLLLTEADRVIVPSSALVDHVVAHGCPRRRVRVIACGVAHRFFAPEIRVREAAGHGEPFVVGFLGSLKPWHGVEILLETFAKLRDIDPGYRLLIVGDGPLRHLVDEFRDASSGGDSVTITGEVPHDDVPPYLAMMDVGVAPYPPLPLFYFSPLKIFEYAAAGVPIVASAEGQIGELFIHRRSAMLHPPEQPEQIALHIEKLRLNPDLRRRLARRARHVVARAYTWDHLAARLLELARHCLSAAD